MRSLDEARKWWLQLDNVRSLSHLKHRVGEQSGEASIATGLRSVCWKCFLLFKNVDRSTWSAILADSRSAYDSLRMHFLRAIEHPDELESAIDPLSEHNESPWVALRRDEALRAEIFQDVERCMPDNVYFRQPSTQNMLLDILFIFAKLNPDVGYKQGMHELLAPILWVIERDAVDPKAIKDVGTAQQDDDLLKTMFDPDHIEHDAFTLFGLVMQNAKSFYESSEARRSVDKTSNGSRQGATNESPMLDRCRRVFEQYLPSADPELAAHLQEVDIVPQIFLMRWIRLLFGREFPFDDVLSIWDVLFAEDPSLELVDHICIAMLLRVRWRLIDADNSAALTILLHYPEPRASQPPRTFVQDALYLKEHLNPDGGSHIISMYTKRPPPLISRLEPPRPPRPAKQPQRISARSSHRTPSSLSPPANSVLQPGGLESLVQDAARNFYSRGEKWGLNQAVRDAVEEVKKNMQGLQLPPAPSPSRMRQRAASSRAIGSGGPDDASGDLPSDLMHRIAALEGRNKSLAKMLEGAVAELWDLQKAGFDGKADEESVKALSVAIAKVQFVQVYLEDASIPLPTEKAATKSDEATPAATVTKTAASAEQSATPPPSKVPTTPPTQPAESNVTRPAIPNPVPNARDQLYRSSATPNITKPAPKPHHRPSTAHVPPPASTSTPPRSAHSTNPTTNLAPPTRPPLAQSSFSWMLGQGESSSSPTSPTLPFGVEGSERRRFAGRGFLFGEDEDEDLGEKEKRWGRGKGQGKKTEGRAEVFDLSELGKR